MRVKDSLRQVIGKTVDGVVVCRNPDRSQLFLAFEDGTSFEFWVSDADLSMASRIDQQSLTKVIEILGRESHNKFAIFDHKNRHQRDVGDQIQEERCRLAFEDVTPDEAMHLAGCHRTRFLRMLHGVKEPEDIEGWARLLVRAFASLLINEDLGELDRAFYRTSTWHEVVRPPSVLPCELMYFLGGLERANEEIARRISSRGAIQAFKRFVDPSGQWYAEGRDLWPDS